jgi:D-beta-D-heptose 7-phosphate kinase / D-beta-D-heptose 1-phosphate adenosyltransferase
VESDAALRQRKGPSRPLQPELVRAARLATLPCVDLVVVQDEESTAALLRALRPDLLVNGAGPGAARGEDAILLEEWGGRIMLADLLPEGTAGG